MIPDPLQSLIAYLKNVPEVLDLTDGRVFGFSLPKTESKEMPRQSVVVQATGGQGRAHSPQYTLRVDVRTYGPTPAKAMDLQLACHKALRSLIRQIPIEDGALLYSAIIQTGIYSGIESITLWPYHFSVWAIETNYSEV